MALSDLTELPDYDGFAGVGKPLRNTELNAALYLGRQERVAGKQAAIGYFASALRVMREGHILACGIRSEGMEGNSMEAIIPHIEDEESRQGIPLFTDYVSYKRFISKHEWARRLFSGAEQMILDYEAFRSLLLANPNTVFVLNPAEADFVFTCDSFLGIETAMLIRDIRRQYTLGTVRAGCGSA